MNKIKEFSREWREKYPEKVRKLEEQWIKNIENHPEYMEEYRKLIREGNRLYGKASSNQKLKYRDDLMYNLNCRMSSLIWYSLRRNKKGKHWEDFVDYDLRALVRRLKRTMPQGYNWEDYMNGGLHIDHKIPRSVFNFTKPEHIDFQRCWALSNLQLLPAKENRVKHNKLKRPFQPALKLEV